ncbi:MAG: histidine kinase [Bacteroidetes bacterium]|nr:histidine kinase [Bacteroidota bacterium]
MRNFIQILWFAFATLPYLVSAQDEEEASYFTRYTMEHGLADNWVHVAMRDSHGFLWFGTEGGLSRFDGQTFLNFYARKDAPDALSNNSIVDMCEDPDGTFWLAVLDGGLDHFDPATGKFESWKTDPNSPEIKGQLLSLTSICQDGDLLWLGSYHHGLGCFDKKKRQFTGWYSFREDGLKANSFQYNTVKHVISDRKHPGFLWVTAAGRGLARFDIRNKTFDIIQIEDYAKIAGVAAMKLLEDEQGKVWIATWSAGVASFDPATRQLTTFPYNRPLWKKRASNRNIALAILEKNADELWIATEDNGFGVFEKNSGKYHFFRNALSGESPELDRNCQGLYLDPEQRLWVLGVQGGVRSYNFQNQSFRYISLASGDAKTERVEVTDFAYNPLRKVVFVATENSGCYEWSDVGSRLTQRAKPIPGGLFPNFRTVTCDTKGNVWAGALKTLGGEASLYLLRPGQAFFEPVILPFPKPRALEETVNDISEDSKGNIWVATNYDGLYKISLGIRAVKRFAEDEGFAKGLPAFEKWWAFLDVKEDRRGHLWLALKSSGVLDFDPQTSSFVKYDDQNVLASNHARSLEIGLDGSIWVGTKNQGLQVLMPGWQIKSSVGTLDKKQGLPGDYVSCIEKDETGNLWMATNKGLAVYDPTGNQFKVFAKAEGLKDTYLTGKGLAIFPGLGVLVGQPNGFCLLRQTSAQANNIAPVKVALTDFKVFDQSNYFEKNIRNAKVVELKPSENVFSFEFAAPTSLNADLTAYQFMLEGFDEKWYTAEGRKSITYTDLQPGNYTFRVRVGESTSPETTLKICILPHWWQAWWFWTAVLLAGVLAVWAFIRYRTSQVRHEEQLKTEFYKKLSETEMTALRSQMNPHFIFNCLNSINHFVVRNDSEQAANYISKFSRLIRLVLDNSGSQKVPLEKELEALQLYMDLEAMRFGGKFRYELWVDDEVDAQFTQIPPMLLQPYVENAIWHGLMHKPEGGSVIVDVRLSNENLLHVEITDDGVGRARAAELESKTSLQHIPQGTFITAERLRMLDPDNPNGGKVTIQDLVDTEGQPCGTKVVLEIPV